MQAYREFKFQAVYFMLESDSYFMRGACLSCLLIVCLSKEFLSFFYFSVRIAIVVLIKSYSWFSVEPMQFGIEIPIRDKTTSICF